MAALGHTPVALRLMDMVPLTGSQNMQECHRPQLIQGAEGTRRGFRHSCLVARESARNRFLNYFYFHCLDKLEINLIKENPDWFNKGLKSIICIFSIV